MICKGYLRTGKILLLLKENKKARDIYDLGCRVTNSSDPHHEVRFLATSVLCNVLKGDQNLQQMLRRMSPVAKDPLSVLPFEILKLVMEYLTLKQLV